MRTMKRVLTGFFAVLLIVVLFPAEAKADPPPSGCPNDPNGRHSWVFKGALPAECEVQARRIWKCENCGQEYTEYTGNPMGHRWSELDLEGEPTCTDSAYETRVCSWCGKVEERRVPALGHAWDSGRVTKAATCSKEGEKIVTCRRCGAKKTETIPKTRHTPVTLRGRAATCTQTGLTEGRKCSVCGVVIKRQETIPALGHKWDEGLVTRVPTDTEDGEMTYTCDRCGVVKTEKIPAGTPAPSIHQTVIIAEDAGKGKAVNNALVYFDRVITNTGNCPLTVSYGYEHITSSVLPDGTVLGAVNWIDVPLQPGESLTLNCADMVFETEPGVFELEFSSWSCRGCYIKEDGTEEYVWGNTVTIDVLLTPPENPSAMLSWPESDRWENHAGEGKLLAGASVQSELILVNDGDRPFTVKLDETSSISGISGGSHTLNPGETVYIIQQNAVLPEMIETGIFEKQYSFTCFYKADDGVDGSFETNIVTVSIPLTK